MKKFISIILISVILLAAVSCDSEPEAAEGERTETVISPNTEGGEDSSTVKNSEDIVIDSASDYVIIYPNGSTGDQNLATKIAKLIKDKIGLTVDCKSDGVAASENEILVGKTNREESTTAYVRMASNDYAVTVVNRKLAICLNKNESEYRDVLLVRLEKLFEENKSGKKLAFSWNFKLLDNKEAVERLSATATANTRISFDFKRTHTNSELVLRIGSLNKKSGMFTGYELLLGADGLVLSSCGNQKNELLNEAYKFELDKKYGIVLDYDGAYTQIYVSNTGDVKGIDARWPDFEAKTGGLSGAVYIGELSGYGADIKNVEVTKDGNDKFSKLSYNNGAIFAGADPDILYYDGYYYVYGTGDGYYVRKSADLVNWETVGASLPGSAWGSSNRGSMWAPDVEYIDGKFYMAVTVDEGLGIAVADKPEGPFVCKNKIFNGLSDYRAIDGNIFVDDDGKIYMYYTSWEGRNTTKRYGIYGMELKLNNGTLEPVWNTEKNIFYPSEAWENTENLGGIVEAPFMMKKDGTYFLVYTGSHFQSKQYAVGYATSSNPLTGFVKYANNPILVQPDGLNGTGHCSIVSAPSGKMGIIYHYHDAVQSYNYRWIKMAPIHFVKEGNTYKLEMIK